MRVPQRLCACQTCRHLAQLLDYSDPMGFDVGLFVTPCEKAWHHGGGERCYKARWDTGLRVAGSGTQVQLGCCPPHERESTPVFPLNTHSERQTVLCTWQGLVGLKEIRSVKHRSREDAFINVRFISHPPAWDLFQVLG